MLSYRRLGDEASRFLCCGKLVCKACVPDLHKHYGATCIVCRAELPRTKEEGFKLVMAHALAGKPWAQYALGNKYELGTGVRQSIELAQEWFAKAAEAGYPKAQSAIGSTSVQHIESDVSPHLAPHSLL